MSAIATTPTRWEETVNLNLLLSVPFALVGDALIEESKRSIRDGLGKLVVSDHTTNVQVLHVNHVEATNKVSSNFVDMVSTTVRYLLLNLRYCPTLLLKAHATLLLSGKITLSLSQLRSVLGSVLGIRNSLSIAQRSKTVNTEVNTNGFASLLQRLDFFVKYESHEVVTDTRLGYRHGGWTTREFSTPTNIKLTELGNGERFVLLAVLKCRGGVLSRLATMLLLEGRILRPTIKKVVVCFLKMAQDLLSRYARDIIQPCVRLFFLQGGEFGTGLIVVHLDAIVVLVRAIAQHVIVDVPASAERSRKLPFLVRCRIKSKSISQFHKSIVHLVRRKVNLTGSWNYIPQVSAAPIPPSPKGTGFLGESL